MNVSKKTYDSKILQFKLYVHLTELQKNIVYPEKVYAYLFSLSRYYKVRFAHGIAHELSMQAKGV